MLDFMEADRARLSDLDIRIMEVESSLSALRAKRALVQHRLDAYKYPILTVPNEITSEIFMHFLPDYPAVSPLNGLASPTSLTHVCHKWREVALATPALWRAIRFNNHHIPYEEILPICRTWIKRSGSCALSIDINLDNSDILHKIFAEPLAMATMRWEHLNLWVPPQPPWAQPSFPNIGSMPMLRSLNLTSPMGPDVSTFSQVPQLRTVVLGNSGVISKITLPWIQLTSLTLKYVSVAQCTRILVETLNLVQCTLYLDSADGLGVFTDLALPCLESLALQDDSWEQTVGERFLNRFTVPSLRRLELEEVFLGAEPITALELFISKSRCRLQEVCISEDTAKHHELYRQAFPSIPVFSFTSKRRLGF
ncbi:F-box domain-containing protein [Mycena sanguinolenta]|uniref:F-box domain-containing protein n=1 Tax=Mycena sanguinolenta TaxID=230812 RepID=A0A8H7DLN5_9AGAR|nr:F-box domain-containing protein [Mycena sanguinolenta]